MRERKLKDRERERGKEGEWTRKKNEKLKEKSKEFKENDETKLGFLFLNYQLSSNY